MENMGIIKTIVFGDKSLTEKQEKNRPTPSHKSSIMRYMAFDKTNTTLLIVFRGVMIVGKKSFLRPQIISSCPRMILC